MADNFTAPYQPDPYDDRSRQNDQPTIPMRPLTNAEMGLNPARLVPGGRGGNPPPPPPRRIAPAIIAGALIFVLIIGGIVVITARHSTPPTACDSCGTQAATGAPTRTAATATVSPTSAPATATVPPTTVPTTTCAAIAAFANAGAAATNSTNFLAVPFLANTVMQPPVDGESNGFQTRSLSLCTPGATTAANLQATIGTALTGKGWQPANPPSANQRCGTAGCWNQSDTSTTPATTQYIGLDTITLNGSVATYTLRLTIAPLFTGNGVPMNSNSTFAFDQSPRAELQWDATLHAIASNNVIGVQLATNSYAATTYTVLSQKTGSFGPLPDIPRVVGSACALQGTRGFYIKFVIQAATSHQLMLTYVVYPYGF